jgi:hypothetical protein
MNAVELLLIIIGVGVTVVTIVFVRSTARR